jgi:crossover junction endodeoxyribonuclease RuvC
LSGIILGIDPGTALMGYGLVNETDAGLELVAYGALSTQARTSLPSRLLSLYQQLKLVIEEYNPAEMAVEELFFNKNTTTAIGVGQARGVALLAAAQYNMQFFEYTPLQVKQSLVGYGRATKDQIQQMVRLTLNLEENPKPDDAADALAIAICHCRSRQFLQRISESL